MTKYCLIVARRNGRIVKKTYKERYAVSTFYAYHQPPYDKVYLFSHPDKRGIRHCLRYWHGESRMAFRHFIFDEGTGP